MKRVKRFLILIFLSLLTGCSGTYSLKINKDLSVEEEVSYTVENKQDYYERLEKLFKDNNVSKDNYSLKEVEKNIRVNYNNKYNSIEEYIANSKLYKQLFEDIEYSNDTNEIELKTNTKLKLDSNNSNINNSFDIKLLNIDIETPLRVESENSDYNDDDVMRWILDENQTEKNISLTLSLTNSSSALYVVLLVFIIIAITVLIIYGVRRFLKFHKMN